MGTYREYCQPCMNRWSAHPVRRWYTQRLRTIQDAAQARYLARLNQAAGVKRRTAAKTAAALRGALPTPVKVTIRAEVLGQHDRIRARFVAYADPQIGEWAPTAGKGTP